MLLFYYYRFVKISKDRFLVFNLLEHVKILHCFINVKHVIYNWFFRRSIHNIL